MENETDHDFAACPECGSCFEFSLLFGDGPGDVDQAKCPDCGVVSDSSDWVFE
jgi:uncharacterized protein (UPF0212 family)